MIGDPHVRHKGTIGGSIANNDPAADYPAALLALGATDRHQQARDRGRRLLHRACSRRRSEEGEIVTAVTLHGAGQGRLCQVPAIRPRAMR